MESKDLEYVLFDDSVGGDFDYFREHIEDIAANLMNRADLFEELSICFFKQWYPCCVFVL